MNLILSGLTGAGKSSLSRSVAERLGREWVSGSAIRRRLVTGGPARVRQSPAEREFWLRSPEAIAADRDRMRDARIDRSLDRELARTHDQRCDVVFDAWFMAWHVRRPSLRVWLDSPLEVRADRVASDLGADGAARNLTEEVMAKDERSRAGRDHHRGQDRAGALPPPSRSRHRSRARRLMCSLRPRGRSSRPYRRAARFSCTS
ncbi:MAG TPA: hypothetical protein VKY91_00275 [Vulgatibacteraceae bacterium]|nr:hypothetical protein [Vulgatibacteraceae bacterium]